MRPSILGFFTVGMTTLSMLSVSCVLYSAGSGSGILEPKVIVSGGITKDGMSKSKVDPCGVCSLRGKTN